MMLAALLFMISVAPAAESSKVIDLGDIEVKGELRKPFVQYVDTEKTTQKLLPELSRQKLEEFERKLLQSKDASATKETSHEKN